MRVWRFISIALISCSSSTLLVFICRRFVGLTIPILLLRLLAIAVIFWLLFDDDRDKALYGTIGAAALAGWFLGDWDEVAVSLSYGFLAIPSWLNFLSLVPAAIWALLALVVAAFLILSLPLLYERFKNLPKSN